MTPPRITSRTPRAALVTEIHTLRRRVAALELHASRKQRRDICDGRPLASALHAAGWTHAQIAAAIGVCRQRVSSWSTGKVGLPRFHALAIVDAFAAQGATPPVFDLGET